MVYQRAVWPHSLELGAEAMSSSMASTAKLFLISNPPQHLYFAPPHNLVPQHVHPYRNKKNRSTRSSVAATLLPFEATAIADTVTSIAATAASDEVTSSGYSQASYYTSLGLFVISVPGLWSLIKRSVKSKVLNKLLFFCKGLLVIWRFGCLNR